MTQESPVLNIYDSMYWDNPDVLKFTLQILEQNCTIIPASEIIMGVMLS